MASLEMFQNDDSRISVRHIFTAKLPIEKLSEAVWF